MTSSLLYIVTILGSDVFLKKIRTGKSSLGYIINVYGFSLDGEAILGIKKSY